MDLPGFPDQGTTKGPSSSQPGAYAYYPDELETAGPRATEPVNMALPTESDWRDLFALMRHMRPFIEYFDSLALLENPPAFIDQPWRFETPEIIKVWPDYKAMRDEYTEAATTLWNEHEEQVGAKSLAPLGGGVIVWVAAIVTVVAVASIIDLYFINEIKKSDLQKLGEADIPVESQPILVQATEKVAKNNGIKIPELLSKGLDVVKIGLVAAIAWAGAKILKVI